MFRHCTLSCSLLAVALFASISVATAEEPTPFVAGFDRFASDDPHEQVRSGRLLLAELGCTACHQSEDPLLAPKPGPDLSSAGVRLRKDWVRDYLQAPSHTRPGATMPAMLAAVPEADRAEIASHLTAFLMTLRKPLPVLESTALFPVEPQFWNNGDITRGRDLYHHAGCVACHAPDQEYEPAEAPLSDRDKLLAQLDPEDLEELGLANLAQPVPSVPLPDLPAKYTREALAHFLLDPAHFRPAGRMPSLKLKPIEAADIVAYLFRDAPDAGPPMPKQVDPRHAAEGGIAFGVLGCANCHSIGRDLPDAPLARPLSELDFEASLGCLGEPHKGLPHYVLSEQQQSAIAAALAAVGQPDEAPVTAHEQVEFTLRQLNCYACHERNGAGGVGPNRRGFFVSAHEVDLGDEGRLPPPLDHVGQKLTTPWLKTVLAGKGDVRPHLRARMPIFTSPQASALPAQLAKADGASTAKPHEAFALQEATADAGRQLLNTGCVQCHPLRGESLPGVVGVDVAHIDQRIRPQWFRDFLWNPASLKPRTRMPTLFPGGVSANQELLEGDVEAQIASMWLYLNEIDRHPLPQRLEDEKLHDYELVPTDQPILLRTFMEIAGVRSIAVGFPEQLHFAFDAHSVRPALAWKGKFLDAHGTWFNRFAPPAEPLGTDVIEFPDGVPLAALTSRDEPWPAETGSDAGYTFRGYRLDDEGVPTFLYEFAGHRIADRIEPANGHQFRRVLQITRGNKDSSHSASLYFRGLSGPGLQVHDEHVTDPDSGWTICSSHEGFERQQRDRSEWLIPVTSDKIEVLYQW